MAVRKEKMQDLEAEINRRSQELDDSLMHTASLARELRLLILMRDASEEAAASQSRPTRRRAINVADAE